MTSLCIIADTHKKHRQVAIPKCDILIHCGDFCSFQNHDIQTLEDVDMWFAGNCLPQKSCAPGEITTSCCITGSSDSRRRHCCRTP